MSQVSPSFFKVLPAQTPALQRLDLGHRHQAWVPDMSHPGWCLDSSLVHLPVVFFPSFHTTVLRERSAVSVAETSNSDRVVWSRHLPQMMTVRSEQCIKFNEDIKEHRLARKDLTSRGKNGP